MKHLIIITTNLCNFKCGFCLRGKDKRSIELNLFKKILVQAKKLNYDMICITGGEPYLHPNFYELIDLVVREGFNFTIVSNGYEYEKYTPLLKYKEYFKRITFSLDAGNEKIHDKFRGKNSFKRVIKAIKYFSNKIEVHTSICLSKFNISEIKNFTSLSEKLGAKKGNFLSVIPTGKNEKYVLSDEERQECYEKINSLKKVKIDLIILCSLYTKGGVDFCRALDLTDVAVNPKGELIFCCDTFGNGAVLGSLKKQTLSYLIKKGKGVSDFLKEKRVQHYLRNEFFSGFNTCAFCNKYLKK